MNDQVTFYYNPRSRGRIVHWMLEEAAADYEIKFLDWQKGDHKSPEYLKINPMGKIPAIIHKGVVVTEAAAICAYLADAFPQNQLAPRIDDPARGTYYRWLFFAASNVEYAMIDRRAPRAQPLPSGAIGYGTYEDTVNALEQAVSQGYILGDRFSAADVYVAMQIGWGIHQKDLEPRPAFQLYLQRCTERPAYKRYMEKAGPL